MVIGKGVRMFNKKPRKAMYFPESVFFAKDNIYRAESNLFAIGEIQKEFEKSGQYTLLEIERSYNKKYANFNEHDLKLFNSKFRYCSVGILSKNKEIIKTLLGLIIDSNWKRTGWYTTDVNIKGTFIYDHFTIDGFNVKKLEPFGKIYWLETNRLKGDYKEVKDTLSNLNLNIDSGTEIIFLGSKGISIKFQIIEDLITNLITIRYCYETIGGLSEVKSVSLNAGKFKSYMIHLYKERADKRMAIYQFDNKCATKEEYIKHNAQQVGIGFTWYIINKSLRELTLETHEDILIRNIFNVKAKNIEEEIQIIFPMIEKCYSDAKEKYIGIPTVRMKTNQETWLHYEYFDFGFEIVGNSDIHKDIYHTISYIIIYLINKYNMQGKYAYRTHIDENKSRVGIENNY